MVGTDVAVRTQPQQIVRLSNEQLRYISQTEFVPKGMRGKLPQILACIAMGRELGLGDMVALNTIHVIDGRASLSAEAMVSLVRKRGHSIQGNFSGDSCTVSGRRADNGDEMTATWTKEMAVEAGLASKSNWKSYPASMLWARAVSQLCRMLFADCFAGGTYTPEELEQGTPAEFDEIESPELGPAGPGSDAVGDPKAGESADSVQPGRPVSEVVTGEAPSPTAPQLKKLNLLVGTLRDAGHITTPMVWQAVGRDPVVSEDGELHWSPLRDSLTKQEASELIERLQKFADTIGSGVAA